MAKEAVQQYPAFGDNICSSCRYRFSSQLCWICGRCRECERFHLKCRNCNIGIWESCAACKNCYTCCHCVPCKGCGKLQRDFVCTKCGECSECCGQECTQEKPYRVAREARPTDCGIKFWMAKENERRINPSERFIAAEIEVAGKNDEWYASVIEEVNKWGGRVVRDGSLPQGGFEINTAPAAGDQFIKEIRAICQTLQKAGAFVTEKCGLHVHVDARDYSYQDIRRLALVYAALEPALFQMVNAYRRSNIYCMPCGQRFHQAMKFQEKPLKDLKKEVFQGIYAMGFEARVYREWKDSAHRYSALNLHSWFYRGTIECRLFGGTVRSAKIIRWGMLWAKILDQVIRWTDAEAEEKIRGKTPEEVLAILLGEDERLAAFVAKRREVTKSASYIEV